MMHHDEAVPETARLLMNSAAYGTVMSVDLSDPTAPRAVVNVNSLQSAPMPWLARRAGPDSDWWAPEVGEQVAVLCTYGDTVQGIILGSIYQESFPAPSQSADVWRKQFKDGTFLQYDRAAHVLTVDTTHSNGTVVINCQAATVKATGSVTFDAPTAHFTGDVQVDKTLTATTDVVGGGKSLKGHTHGGVQSGSSHTAPPD